MFKFISCYWLIICSDDFFNDTNCIWNMFDTDEWILFCWADPYINDFDYIYALFYNNGQSDDEVIPPDQR